MRITSDGTSHGTKVFDDFGKELQNVAAIEIKVAHTGFVQAKITFVLTEFDIEVIDPVVETKNLDGTVVS